MVAVAELEFDIDQLQCLIREQLLAEVEANAERIARFIPTSLNGGRSPKGSSITEPSSGFPGSNGRIPRLLSRAITRLSCVIVLCEFR